ncbi:MAG TPA: urea ABC transporter permease subunit UrtB [Polyangiaceae bacterium]|nr:urea ABC transporter permease subunit UrtB [Polyangiaceae bacterium]
MRIVSLLLSYLVVAWVSLSGLARAAGETETDVAALGAKDGALVVQAISRIAERGDVAALPALEALADEKLKFDSAGHAFIDDDGAVKSALPGGPAPSGPLTGVELDNALRRAVEPALAALRLSSPDRAVRLTAAAELEKRPSEDSAALLRKALVEESDAEVKKAFELALAHGELESKDAAVRLHAVRIVAESGDVGFRGDMDRLAGASEPDPAVRAAAKRTLGSLESKIALIGAVGHLFYGVSLGSVLLLAALGLAITFGLMRVINMAHGEMLMLGAYATFSVQGFFGSHFPAHQDAYLFFAVPVAFALTFGVGVVLERTVIRHLYGRPLETLLATWGISLVLIQTVRMIYGAQNVTVANPEWLSGGYQLLPGVVLTYSRVTVIFFSALVVLFTWLVMNKTKLGLELRAVVQNREMAAALGIATRRVDMWTFGIGSGIAGLGGVALSQLGNVGPELGQGYIVDSFMVVVLGGVGKLLGTIVGAFGLGILNKILEPAAGAVLGKIVILGFIILFVQKRPQGIFAQKGRFAEAT